MPVNIGVNIQRSPNRINQQLREAGVEGKFPKLLLDFKDEYYLASGGSKTLANAVTHARAGNAVMTDGYGPELVVNGGFDSDSDWTLNSGEAATFSVSAGKAQIQSGPSRGRISQALSTTVGTTYIVEATKSLGTAAVLQRGQVKIGTSSGGGDVVLNDVMSESVEFAFTATAATTYVTLQVEQGNVYMEFDNVSVREMPVLKWAPHNLVAYSEQFDNSFWAKGRGTIQANTTTAPDGTETADTFTENTASGSHYVVTTLSCDPNTTFTATGYVKYKSRNFGAIALQQNTSGNSYIGSTFIHFNLSTGAYSATSGGGTEPTNISYSSESVGNGWYKIQITGTLSSTAGKVQMFLAPSTGSTNNYAGDGSSGIYIWGAHLYRSDLGGMVDNPERGDSYVPTALRPFGASLVTNGTFDTDTTDWSPLSSASLSVASGALRITNVGANFGKAYQAITVEANKAYVLTFDKIGGTSTDAKVRVGSTAGGTNILGNTTVLSNGSYSFSFVPTVTTVYVAFVNDGVDGNYNDFDNVVVRESSVRPDTARYLPRIGHHVYNGSAWVNEGLLAESESRTNGLTYSNELTNAAWTKTVQIEEVDDRYGFTLFRTYQAGTSSFNNIQQAGPTVADDGYVTLSAYVKAGTSPQTAIRIQETANTERCTQPISWTNGVPSFDSVIDTAALQLHNRTIQDVGDGLYRASITVQNTTGASIGTVMHHYNQWNGTSDSPDSYVGAMQAELGATPSSYIPTSGSTVSRAAETFTIPSANLPWPSPQYIGSELVTNGDFSNGETGFTEGGDGSGSVSNEEYTIVRGATSDQTLRQSVATVIGKIYELSVDVSANDGRNYKILAPNADSGYGNNTGKQRLAFYATSTSSEVRFQQGGANGGTSTFDNFSVREINPLSVSIAMDGRVTYADEDAGGTAFFYRWQEDANNIIRTTLDTNSGRSGRISFQQVESNTYDIVNADDDILSPDVFVPFDIASRHGSAFINGAVDGVALTADTTPTALADLSATDLNLAYDYMGTVGTFRIWDKDIADTGLVEATNPSLEPSLSLTFEGVGTNSFVVNDWSE